MLIQGCPRAERVREGFVSHPRVVQANPLSLMIGSESEACPQGAAANPLCPQCTFDKGHYLKTIIIRTYTHITTYERNNRSKEADTIHTFFYTSTCIHSYIHIFFIYILILFLSFLFFVHLFSYILTHVFETETGEGTTGRDGGTNRT